MAKSGCAVVVWQGLLYRGTNEDDAATTPSPDASFIHAAIGKEAGQKAAIMPDQPKTSPASKVQTSRLDKPAPVARTVPQAPARPVAAPPVQPQQDDVRATRMRAEPYRPPVDHRDQLRNFAMGGPMGWFHATAHKVDLVIRPTFTALVFVLNLGLGVVWSLLQLGAQWLPDNSRRQVRAIRAPRLDAEHPVAVVAVLLMLALFIGSVARPIVWPATDPREFVSETHPWALNTHNPFAIIARLFGASGAVISSWRPPGNPFAAISPDSPQDLVLERRPPGDYNLQGLPSLTPAEIDRILAAYGSPATGSGQAWYNLGIKYGIDPAFAVAFFIHESSAGTNPNWAGIKPDGSTTHNVGNIICAGYSRCYGRFRDYPSWEAGIDDWYRLIDVEYIQGRGHRTVADVIPVYAPSFENDVQGYINAVTRLVDGWRTNGVP